MFSNDADRIATAFRRLQPRLQTWSSLLNQLLNFYNLEGMAMPYTMEDLERDAAQTLLNKLTPEQRLQGLAPEQRLQGLAPEQRLQGLAPEQRLQGLAPEQVLSLVPIAAIEDFLKKRKTTQDNAGPEQV